MAWNIRSCVYKPIYISVARWQGSQAGFLSSWGQPLPSVILNRKNICVTADLPWPRTANKSLHSFNNLSVYFHQEARCSSAMQETLSWAPWLPPPLRRKVAHSNPLIKKLPVLVETNQNIYSKSKLKKNVNLMNPWKHPNAGVKLSAELLNDNSNKDHTGKKSMRTEMVILGQNEPQSLTPFLMVFYFNAIFSATYRGFSDQSPLATLPHHIFFLLVLRQPLSTWKKRKIVLRQRMWANWKTSLSSD